MVNSNREIYRLWRQTKNKDKEVEILAQVNSCSEERIMEIIDEMKKKDEEDRKQTSSASRLTYTNDLKDKIRELIKQGKSASEVVEILELQDTGSGATQQYYKLKRELRIKGELNTDVEVLSAKNSGSFKPKTKTPVVKRNKNDIVSSKDAMKDERDKFVKRMTGTSDTSTLKVMSKEEHNASHSYTTGSTSDLSSAKEKKDKTLGLKKELSSDDKAKLARYCAKRKSTLERDINTTKEHLNELLEEFEYLEEVDSVIGGKKS